VAVARAKRPRPSGAAALGPAIATVLLALPSATSGAEWRVEPSLGGRATITDNVNLAPRDQRESDLILEVTPGIRITGRGARLQLDASYTPSVVLYADRSDLDTFYNSLYATASLEAIEKFFFVEARATMTQQYLSPFGPRPRDLATSTSNRTEVRSYGVSPYFRGQFAGGTRYLLRNDSDWVDPHDGGGLGSYYSNTTGLLENTVARIGWGLDYNRASSKFEDSNSLTNWLARARLIYQLDPQLIVFGSGGYEENNYALTDRSNAIYGAGLTWRPTERTNIVANWEYRFFGDSYLVSFDHRTRLTAWSISAARNISRYPQEALTLPPGNTAALLNAIFAARIPDPAARQTAVQQFIAQTGLPAFLSVPQAFYTEQVFLEEPIVASFAILGARNTIAFTAGWASNERISGTTGTPLPDVFGFSNRFVTYGLGANWSHRVTPLSTLNLFGSWLRTDNEEPTVFSTTQDSLYLTWDTRLSPKTNSALGVRYTVFDSDLAPGYRETAIFGSLNHRF
jgi:uncharacterized protein (PEP-CTERM system associated)